MCHQKSRTLSSRRSALLHKITILFCCCKNLISFVRLQNAGNPIKSTDLVKMNISGIDKNCEFQGEWANNAKNGYGVTTLRDGTREEGKYKNNVLIVSARRKGVLFVRSGKLKERVEGAIEAATRAASIAQQKVGRIRVF